MTRGLRRAWAALVGVSGVAWLAASPAADPPSPDTLIGQGRYREAAAAARGILDSGATDPHLWHVLGNALTATGDTDGALGAYARAATGDLGHRLRIEVATAVIALQKANTADAERRLHRVLEAYQAGGALPASELAAAADAARLLGNEDPTRYRQALDLYEQALDRDPGYLDARVALADLLLEKYNNAEALSLYRDVLSADENHPGALLGLARSHYFDHSRTAIDAVRRVLEVQPTLVSARVLLARMLLEMEDYAAAEEELAQALEVNPASPEALTMKLVVFYLRGDQPGFDALLTRLRQLVPGYHEMFATLAEIAAQNRLYADAARFAMEAVRRDSTFWRAHGLLGLNQLRLGQITAGRSSLERAFRGDPFNVWIKNNLDMLDRLDGFATLRRGRFLLSAAPGQAELLAPLLFPLAEAAYDHFSERYQHRPSTPIRIEIYPRHEDFSVRTVGLVGLDILGVSFGPTVALPSPSADTVGSVNWGSVLWHELAHTFHLSMSASRVPRWFTEGLAVWEEHRARPGWGQDVDPGFLEAYRRGRLPPASRLNQAFLRPEYPEQVGYAYLLSSLLLEFIEEQYGIESLRAMLTGFREGASADPVLTALDLTPESLDQEFDAYLRTRFDHMLGMTIGDASAVTAPISPGAGGGSFRALWLAGGQALEAGDLEGAQILLEQAKALFPEFAGQGSPYELLAQVHRRRGDLPAAVSELEAVVDTDADYLDAHLQLAELYLESGDTAAAAATFERALFINPFRADLRNQLASIYEANGDWQRAVPERDAAAALDPMDPAGARFRLALALNRTGEQAGAHREVLRALEIAPMYDDALELLLEVRTALDREPQATAAPSRDPSPLPADRTRPGPNLRSP